uniref:Family with sequence similarity 110 member C n=1 Tax=Amphilophus citrinellus TaxID=61819 RepID=A0A3Q0RAI1_AMPCI
MPVEPTMETTSNATKILGKGPEYLRKQMDLESETKGRKSAVERLAASKPNYVKMISLGSTSVSSTGSSNQSSKHGGNLRTESDSAENMVAVQISSVGQVRQSSSKKRPDSLLLHRQKCELLRGSANDRKHYITRKLLLNSVNTNVPLHEATYKECESKGNMEKISTPEEAAKERSSHVVISEPQSNGVTEECSIKSSGSGTKPKAVVAKASNCLLTVPEVERRSGKGVSRSHSDISSRYSKNFADFDGFFKYCGLDDEVIESMGKENFSPHSDEIVINIRSVSVSTSDDGFSKNSSDSDGLMEEELHQKIVQKTSVIERNARIIKWLYSCKNATGEQNGTNKTRGSKAKHKAHVYQ